MVCKKCGSVSSNDKCKSCLLLEGLNKKKKIKLVIDKSEGSIISNTNAN